ncbi:MAG TPA: YciI family protein [Polyangiaceae bacterium]|nr:YciI family protein [Polyangiaceae bacterium]
MRYIVMHKVDAVMEAGGPPDQSIIDDMGKLVQGSLKEGVFLNGAGLHGSKKRVRLEHSGGEFKLSHGPYQGKNELVAAFTMISAPSLEAAVSHAKTLARSLGDVEIEVGPVVEPWDLGIMPKPEGKLPERFLLLTKATSQDELGGTSAKHAAAVKKLSESFDNDGSVLAADSLAPSKNGWRSAPAAPGKRSWVDGPFAESKELIAGFSLLSLPGKAEVLRWADRYGDILVQCEVDVLEVNEP